MTAPPLLAIMAGRAVRPRRAPQVRPREVSLHLAVADVLRRYCLPAWRYSHFPAGEARDARVGAKLKRMGLRPGWPDFILLRPARGGARGLLHCLELKRVGERLTGEQDAFRHWCEANAVPFAVAHSIEEALAILGEWRCFRIKGAKFSQPPADGGAS